MRNLRLLFLGDRRFAQAAYEILAEDFAHAIDVKGVVTSEDFFEDVVKPRGANQPIFISNAQRNTELIKEAINAKDVDFILSIQHIWKLPKEILELVNWQALNLHNSPLPRYKGYNSICHAILNEDNSYATTIHWMAEQVDSGDLAYEFKLPIRQDETAISLYQRTVQAASRELGQVFEDILNNLVPRRAMIGEGSFYGRNSVQLLRDVTDVLDADEKDRRIRASFFPPYESAYVRSGLRKHYLLPENYSEFLKYYDRPYNLHEVQ